MASKRLLGDSSLLRQVTASSIPLVQLGQTCTKIFIDAGSNLGVHGRFLYEPDKYPGNLFSKIFRKHFFPDSTYNPQEICVMAFEPNPKHAAKQESIQEAYRRKGWRYFYLPFAISDGDGTLQFYRNHRSTVSTREQEVGFSQMLKASSNTTMSTVSVQAIDFSSWLTKNIFFDSDHVPDVIMKMDIEGSEFAVLLALLTDGVLCKFSKLYGEIHPGSAGKLRGTPETPDKGEAKQIFDSINIVLEGAGCPKFKILDDESFLEDGVELP